MRGKLIALLVGVLSVMPVVVTATALDDITRNIDINAAFDFCVNMGLQGNPTAICHKNAMPRFTTSYRMQMPGEGGLNADENSVVDTINNPDFGIVTRLAPPGQQNSNFLGYSVAYRPGGVPVISWP